MNKGLEALKHIENELKFFYQDDWEITRYPKDITIVEKELKALEIIKNVGAVAFYLDKWRVQQVITKEEHELLKEALL